jgi:FlaG/FlaF family flagellin (archaellin)
MKSIQKNNHHDAASEVVGEMLMIGLAIILISVFASVMGNFIPGVHDPSVTIMVTNDAMGNITLWHKGGDWIKVDDLTVITGDDEHRYPLKKGSGAFLLVPEKSVFDLGSNITVRVAETKGNGTVSLVTPKSVIFSGTVGW